MRPGLSRLYLLAIGIVVAGGAGTAAYVDMPSVAMETAGEWGAVDNDSVEIDSVIAVENPNDFAIDLGFVTVTYRVHMNDVLLAHGAQQGPELVPGGTDITVTTTLIQDNIMDWWASHMRNDEVTTLTAEGAVNIGTSLFGRSVDGIEHSREIETDLLPMLEQAMQQLEGRYTYSATGISVADPTIEITDVSAAWGDITATETELLLTLDVRNANAYPLPVPEFVGYTELNEVRLADWQTDDVDLVRGPADGVIPPQTTEEITLGIALDHDRVEDWLTRHIDRGEYTRGTIVARTAFEIDGQQFYVPQDGSIHCAFRFRTAILKDQEQQVYNDNCDTRNTGLSVPDDGISGSGSDGTDTDGSSDDTDNSGDDDGDGGLLGGLG